MKRRFALAVLVVVVVSTASLFIGCGGKSHQAPVPDYSNMTDEGGETDE